MGELGETPFGVKPVCCLDDDDSFGVVDFTIQCAFPIRPGWDAEVFVEVEERSCEAMVLQPAFDLACSFIVATGVRDKYSSHI